MSTIQKSASACYRQRLTRAESDEIRKHQQHLSNEVGCEVSLEHAAYDWQLRFAARWRRQQLRQELEEQIEEMNRHKWIESEKAGADLGDAAIKDWICKFAAQWRQRRV